MRRQPLVLAVVTLLLYTPIGAFAAEPRSATLGIDASSGLERHQLLPVDEDALRAEDSVVAGPGVPLRVGSPQSVALTTVNSGAWVTIADGARLWRLAVSSPGAEWIGIGFDLFRLPEGAELYVYDPAQTSVLGPFGAGDVRPHGELWLPPIEGEETVIELFWPAELSLEEPRLRIGSLSHGYRSLSEPLSKQGESGACNIDVNCPLGDDWQDEKRGVARMLISSTYLCTGSLVNTTAQDCRNMFLTAHHCLDTQGAAAATVFYFNYERPGCESGLGSLSETVSGSTLRATWDDSDTTLLELDDVPPASYEVYYNGWSNADEAATQSWCIHHPRGDVKKISYDEDPLIDGGAVAAHHWRVTEWEQGTTEGGSSGSPLFDQNSRIVGQLHGGIASCSNLAGWDEYGKVSSAWTGGGSASSRLSDWLDPIGSGAASVDGLDATVCSGARPDLEYASHDIDEPGGDRPDAVDPGETVYVLVDVQNQGPGDASDVSGTLSTTDALATLTDADADWPDIPAGEQRQSLSPHFTVELDPNHPCGEAVPLTLAMSAAGAPDAGTSSFELPVGTEIIETLAGGDGLEAGGAGFDAKVEGGEDGWRLVEGDAHSPTYAWRVLGAAEATDATLALAPIEVLPAGAELVFWHRYDTEARRDGGVLELSVDGMSWFDAAAHIVDGGYDRTISAEHGSALAGREAWSGDSERWRRVSVDLSDLAGGSLSLRWRFVSDDSMGGSIWSIDDVKLSSSTWTCDNCPTVANPGQEDFDEDGVGDACESGSRLADANNSRRVDGFDLSLLGRAFGSSSGDASYDPRVDLDHDGLVDGADLALLAAEFGDSVPDW